MRPSVIAVGTALAVPPGTLTRAEPSTVSVPRSRPAWPASAPTKVMRYVMPLVRSTGDRVTVTSFADTPSAATIASRTTS